MEENVNFIRVSFTLAVTFWKQKFVLKMHMTLDYLIARKSKNRQKWTEDLLEASSSYVVYKYSRSILRLIGKPRKTGICPD